MAAVGVWTYLAERLAPKRYGFTGPIYSVRGPWARRAGLLMVVPLLIGLPCGALQAILFLAELDTWWVGVALLIVQAVALVTCGMLVSWIWWKHNSPEGPGPEGAA
jgi:hypothetical protein